MIRAGFLSRPRRPDRFGAGRICGASVGAAGQCVGSARLRLELRVAKALFLDDDTIRQWHGLFIEDGFEGLTRFEAGGSACQLSGKAESVGRGGVVTFTTAPLRTKQLMAV
jgi:hypothetical protein